MFSFLFTCLSNTSKVKPKETVSDLTKNFTVAEYSKYMYFIYQNK